MNRLIRFFLRHIWSRIIRFADGQSQAINALIFNPPHSNESLSGHAHRVGSRWEKVIDRICFWDKQHCRAALRNDIKASELMIEQGKAVKQSTL